MPILIGWVIKIIIGVGISYIGAKMQKKRQKAAQQRAALLWNQSIQGYDSPTYDQKPDYPFPLTTSSEGMVVNMAFGKVRVGSTIIRASSPYETAIRVFMAHNDGLIDAYLAYYINNVEFGNLRGGHVQYDANEGTNVQTESTLFPDDGNRCAYAGIAYTGWEFYLNKGEVKQTPNINVVMRGKYCYDIGQDEDGGTRSFTRNPAQILWNFHVEVEHYTTEQLNTNAFTALETMCNSFPMGVVMPLRPPGPGSTSVKGTSKQSVDYNYWLAFDKDLSRLGEGLHVAWRTQSGVSTNQRLNIDLGGQYVPTQVTIENYHDSGSNSAFGVKNFSVLGSNSKSGFDTTSYAGDAGWTLIESGFSANSHNAVDVSSSQAFTITNSANFRYLSIKMADNHGGPILGVRDIQFWGHSPKHTFDYNFDKKTTINDAKKRIWSSFNGMGLWSQGQIKPVWDGAVEHDGSGGLTAKTVKHAFTEDNTEELVSWGKPRHPNIVRVYFKDGHDYFKTTFVEETDDKDIEDKGEILYEEECYWITERDQARQRVRFLKDKFKITDYVCALRAWPDSQDVEVYDLVTVTHTLPSWTTKEFLVTAKRETQYGTALFELEAYHSGIYHDGDYIETQNYSSGLPNPDAPPPSSTGPAMSYVTTGTKYSYGSLLIEFTPPEYSYYSYTDVFASIDDSTYAWVGKSDGDDIYFNGLGVLYQPGDTVYIKLRSVNANGVSEPIPDNADAQLEITGALRLASWYLGTVDMWAGNAAIGNAATVVVIGDLDGTPKIALGASADSIDAVGTVAGFYADGDGKLYSGNAGATEYFKFDGTHISWASPNTSMSTAGRLTTKSADIGGWNILEGYIYNLQSGQPTAGPVDGLILASANSAMIIYEGVNKRIEAGYLSAGVYGVKGYATDGSTVVFEISNTQQIINSFVVGDFAAGSEISIQGWSADLEYTADDADTVSWSAGNDEIIELMDGTTYTITAGNTGNMAARTYIYLDIGTSTTVLQKTTTAATAIGTGKILLAVAENKTDEAFFQAFGGKGGVLLSAGEIAANAVTANEIAANTITANEIFGNTITLGEVDFDGQVFTDDATKTNVEGWKHASDVTKIDGGDIYTNTVTATQIAANTVTAAQINGTFGALTIASGSITMNANQGVTLTGDDTTPSKLILSGSSYSTYFAGDVDGSDFCIWPSTDKQGSFRIGAKIAGAPGAKQSYSEVTIDGQRITLNTLGSDADARNVIIGMTETHNTSSALQLATYFKQADTSALTAQIYMFAEEGDSYIQFTTSATIRATLNVDGDFGLGTATPGAALDITRAAATADIHLHSEGGDGINWLVRSLTTGTFVIGTATSNSALLYSNGNIQFCQTAGNVGIGTTPESALHVLSAWSHANGVIKVQTNNASAANIVFDTRSVSPNANDRIWALVSNYSANGSFDIMRTTASTGTPETYTVTITKESNVGIGAVTPTSPGSVGTFLHIADAASAGIVLEDTGDLSAFDIYAQTAALHFEYNNVSLFSVYAAKTVRTYGSLTINAVPQPNSMIYSLAADAQATYWKAIEGVTYSDAASNIGVVGQSLGGGGTNNIGVWGGASGASNNYHFYSADTDDCSGNAWNDSCSRDVKHSIKKIKKKQKESLYAQLDDLNIQAYKANGEIDLYPEGEQPERYGLIAEEVPDFLATFKRKTLSAGRLANYGLLCLQHQKTEIEEHKDIISYFCEIFETTYDDALAAARA